jgi:hypothetical protein
MRLNRYLNENKKYLGYKIVHGLMTDTHVKSIYDGSLISLSKSWQHFHGNGMFLGTTKDFCLDYYSLKGEEDAKPELLLTYEFNNDDILKGYPDENGEVQVSKARLIKKEIV